MTFSCGCEIDGRLHCPAHMGDLCHRPETDPEMVEQWIAAVGLCPPCRIAKWRSVSLSSAATPTRRLL